MKKEEEFKDFADPARKEYKNKVFFLYKSRKGGHLYAFINEGDCYNAKSILMNISEIEALIKGNVDHIKISIMPHEEALIKRNVE